jgi:beta-glucanase (GH16 family)
MLSGLMISCSLAVAQTTFSTLVWSDEFETAGAPDTARWVYDLGSGANGWGNNELEYYTNDRKNVRVENGHLIVEAHKETRDGKPYTSARIKTKGKGDWTYGRFETRAKLPKGKGTWPAIWMMPSSRRYGGWPACGEIDIMEHVGYDPGVVHSTIHTELYNHNKGTQKEKTITVADAQETFHVYVLEWDENTLRFFVDDKLFHTIKRNPNEDFKGWPFDQPFHIILNVAVGGNWGAKMGVDENIWPQRMVVDYVRVYQ